MKPLFYSLLLILLQGISLKSSYALTLEEYLAQVSGGNLTAEAARNQIQAASLKGLESNQIHAPQIFGEISRINDHRQNPLFSIYQKYRQDTLSFGVKQQFDFGLKAAVSYTLTQMTYVGLKDPFWEGLPKLEASFSLLRNRFGSETRAQATQIEEASTALKFAESFKQTLLKADAQIAFIRLAGAREIVAIQKQSLESAEELLRSTTRRKNLNLGESSDSYQAEANRAARRLQLISAEDNEATASRMFNSLRQVESDKVSETLIVPDLSNLQNVKVPNRRDIREDIAAQMAQLKASSAQSQMGIERNRTNLELFGQVALNSRRSKMAPAFSSSFDTDIPTSAIGIRLTAPLNLGESRRIQDGYTLEKSAAANELDRKVFENQVEWKTLTENLERAKARFAVALSLSEIQKAKNLNEHSRLRQGRSTTYQTLTFEQDYNFAEVSRIQAQSEILEILTKLQTFGGTIQ